MEYLEYINKIKSLSEENYQIKNKEYYKVNGHLVNLWQDDNNYLDGLQYKNQNDICWIQDKPKEFYEKYCNEDNQLKLVQNQIRYYGEPKLTKPKELKGIKQAFNVDYILKKCKCQIFIKDNDVWVKHNDYFSREQYIPVDKSGLPSHELTEYYGKNIHEKFCYSDNFSGIVLRNQAWLCIKNLIYRLKIGEDILELKDQIVRQQEKTIGCNEYELEVGTMERFYEQLIKETVKYIK